nr:5932_t:CDS:2 [Entrophospora candida]
MRELVNTEDMKFRYLSLPSEESKKIIELAESKRQEIIKSEKYLSRAKNYKHHLDSFYTSRPLNKLIEQANLQNKLSQQSTISIDYDDDSSSKKIQPNSLIGYNLESDASVFMPMHNINDNGSDVNYVRNFNESTGLAQINSKQRNLYR